MDVKKFYQDVAQHVKKLELEHPQGWLYVTSLESPGEDLRMCEVSVRRAAELVVSRSHRISSEDEIVAWEKIQSSRSLAIRKEQAMRDGRVLVMADAETTERVRELTRVANSSVEDEGKGKRKQSA